MVVSAALTTAVHVSVTICHVYLLSCTGGGVGLPSMNVVGVHVAVILGYLGPSSPGLPIGPKFLGLRWWVPNVVNQPTASLLLLVVGLSHYLLVGIVELGSIETSPCSVELVDGTNPSATEILALESSACFLHPLASTPLVPAGTWVTKWTVTERIYFTIVLITTVGYGNSFVPTSPSSRLFTLTYAIFGLLIFGGSASVLASTVPAVFGKMCRILTSTLASDSSSVGDNRDSWNPSNIQNVHLHAHPAYFYLKDIYRNFVAFVFINFLSAAVFYMVEDDWSWYDSLYHTAMTATTIGLGDIAPQTTAGRTFAIFHMVSSVVVFTNVINAVLSAQNRKAKDEKRREMLRKQLDTELIASLDKDGDGVDQTEFILGMLELLGILKESDYEPFVKQFQEVAGKNSLARLTKADLQRLVEMNRSSASRAQRVKTENETVRNLHVLHKAAKLLTLPAGISCLGFLWNAAFGYGLLVAGIIDGGVLGLVLRSSTPNERVVSTACISCIVSSILLLLVVLYVIWFAFDPIAAVDKVDTQFKFTLTSILVDGHSASVSETVVPIFMQAVDDVISRWQSRAILLTYAAILALALGLKLRFVYVTGKIALQLRSSARVAAMPNDGIKSEAPNQTVNSSGVMAFASEDTSGTYVLADA